MRQSPKTIDSSAEESTSNKVGTISFKVVSQLRCWDKHEPFSYMLNTHVLQYHRIFYNAKLPDGLVFFFSRSRINKIENM